MKALRTEGYTTPTPIQEQAIPVVLEGRDLLGSAQTGTGKTAAFAIPILQKLVEQKGSNVRGIRALILTPTRELAAQINESFTAYGRHTGIRQTVVYGGVSQFHQVKAIRSGVEVLIATPGRLLDLMNQKLVNISNVQYFVLDEVDSMLDMGFIIDVRKIIARMPEKRQTLFFSATMPYEISRLADTILTDPVRVEVAPTTSMAEKVEHSVYYVEKTDKLSLLNHLLENHNITNALVFTRTKRGADRVAKHLSKTNVKSDAIHGDKSQPARQKALRNFKSGNIRVLVATDVAARGIDVEFLSHVINFELPNTPETYIHRIGRTGRAGASGQALSFCDFEEHGFLKDINKLIGKTIPIIKDHPYPMTVIEPAPNANKGRNFRRPSNQRFRKRFAKR